MRVLGFSRYALTSCVAAAMLTGCGGSQPPIGAPGAMPQTSAIATHADRGKSWMLPGSSSGDLIYATGGCGGTCVISYPDMKLVGDLPDSGVAICSDAQGNIFLPKDGKVVEYAHGGTAPVATLNLPGGGGGGCTVDPISHNLAVVFESSSASLAIFANEQGTPTQYETHILSNYCGYDGSGNLFVNGFDNQAFALSELPIGSSGFTKLSISQSVGEPGQIQWDGNYMTWETVDKPTIVSRLSIVGSAAKIVGTTTFNTKHKAFQSWISGNIIILPYNIRGTRPNVVGVWKYPKGGKVVSTIRKFGEYAKRTISFQGVTLSLAPSHARTR